MKRFQKFYNLPQVYLDAYAQNFLEVFLSSTFYIYIISLLFTIVKFIFMKRFQKFYNLPQVYLDAYAQKMDDGMLEHPCQET